MEFLMLRKLLLNEYCTFVAATKVDFYFLTTKLGLLLQKMFSPATKVIFAATIFVCSKNIFLSERDDTLRLSTYTFLFCIFRHIYICFNYF